MAGSTFGELFRISTFGESHGGAVGVVIDGCPPGLEISLSEVQAELDRRKPGQSDITTPRKEEDTIHILSGVFEGRTTGTPILMLAHNKDVRSQDYDNLKNLYRPSHADFTYESKYGLRDWREPCAVVAITTDKVYENREWEHPYREDDPLGGHDAGRKVCVHDSTRHWRCRCGRRHTTDSMW